ncbi:MAG: leucine-rich repeat domain-containing protein [Arthrospira sp. PLM2.Bin9]|nr:leucine-rich repeat domain-containing protein [Arthrospira sp. PLM2.Bin9]TVU53590.1 MAG: leucine-rich repeat domain-containing protein [Arthrospira sp. PLM2.Bin9]
MVKRNLLSRWWGVTMMGIAISLTGSISPVSVLAESESSDPSETYTTIMDWCMNRENLSPDARYTVQLILREAGTFNCARASENLLNLNRLDLNTSLIRDVAPLGSLTNLTKLRLMNNRISDISPLANLTNLENLDLSYNLLTDVSDLGKLTNLRVLNLSYNEINDISTLNNLSRLNELNLNHNNISNISSLSSLERITYLFVRHNPIEDQTCPISPRFICQF